MGNRCSGGQSPWIDIVFFDRNYGALVVENNPAVLGSLPNRCASTLSLILNKDIREKVGIRCKLSDGLIANDPTQIRRIPGTRAI